MLVRVVDFETTGFPPDAAVCEVGWQDVRIEAGSASLIGGPLSVLVNPGRAIPPEASAVHHLVDADVADAEPIDKALHLLMDGADVFAAHNAAFERAFFGGGGRSWVCTLKAARRVWPEAPSHSNQVLRYWRPLPVDRSIASTPHRASADAYVTALLLCDLLQSGIAIDDLTAWTEQPSLLPRVGFGKHRGKPWKDIPSDYLDWLLKQDMDEDVKFTARHHLKERAKQGTV